MYAVEISPGATPVVVAGIRRVGMSTGARIRNEVSSGDLYVLFQSLIEQRSTVSFATTSLKAALDKVGLLGWDIATGSAGGVNFFLQKWLSGSTREGTLKHLKFNAAAGLLVPRRLTGEHGGDAEITYEAVLAQTGSTLPIVKSDLVTLPGLDAAETDLRWAIGPVTIDGDVLTHVRSIELDFGLNVQADGGDGDTYPTLVTISDVQPTLTLRGTDPQWLEKYLASPANNIPITGKDALAAGPTTLVLRKRDLGGTYVVNTTAEHIKFTFNGFVHVPTPFDVAGNDPAETTVVLQGRKTTSGAVLPIALNTASAY